MIRGGATLAIGGPTATGKTVLAVELARRGGAELVNADSRQVLRRLRAGTAAPTAAELRGVPCHLLDECDPGEPFTVADWLGRARTVLADLDARGIDAIVVGGTGQYLRALREGWDFGRVTPDVAGREELTASAATPAGLDRLAAELRERDPEGAASVDLSNPRRVVRAVEMLRAAGGSLATARRRSGGRPLGLIVLDADRAAHAAALRQRMAAMFDGGAVVAEVRGELERGTPAAALRRAGIGYAEALAVLDGGLDVDTARASAMRRTRRYVKAQRTWFRHEPAILRVERSADATTASLADEVLDAVARSAGSPR
jgi:tRNA dimethylallyltransferase